MMKRKLAGRRLDQRERDILDYLNFLSIGISRGEIFVEYFVVDNKSHVEDGVNVHDGYRDGTTIEFMYKLTMPLTARDDET